MAFLIVMVVLAIVVFVISSPWRRTAASVVASGPAGSTGSTGPSGPTLAELEAAREAKYAEIREAELDHRTGKLSDEDYEAVNAALRSEAISILRDLDGATIGER